MKYSSPTPEEILAFSEKYARRLFSSSRWQKADREDFTQELVIKLLRAAKRYDPNKNVPWEAYAHVISRGALLDFYRKINDHETLLWESNESDDGLSTEDQIGNLLAVEDFIDLTPKEIVQWSRQFNLQQRKVIICLALGYSRSEISRILGVTEGRITKIIRPIQMTLLLQNER